jgi:uncharacterized protein YjiS (DUF1127 family)
MQNLQYTFCCIAPKFCFVKATHTSVNPRGMTMFDFVKTRYTRWQRFSRTKSELEGLSNRELADLGISRVDIHRLAREATR